jgi:hypothetical protein
MRIPVALLALAPKELALEPVDLLQGDGELLPELVDLFLGLFQIAHRFQT